jgi:suppressor of ftsI
MAFILMVASPVHAVQNTSASPIHELKEYISVNGILNATIETTEQEVRFGEIKVNGMVYNGDYAGVVLRAYPGDVMNITLVNHLQEATNLHWHGLHVSPQGNSDNMHVMVAPGQSYAYKIDIPRDQPPGLYWVHAHIHGKSESQIRAGLSGIVVVEGLEKQLPQIAGLEEKILVLKDYQFTESDNPYVRALHRLVRTINGRLMSDITMRPNETQFWRFSNQSPNLIYNLVLKGHKFRIIATDGVATNAEQIVDRLTILPGGRMEVLVDAAKVGSYDLVVENTITGSGFHQSLQRTLARVTVAGDTTIVTADMKEFPDRLDLRTKTINEKRTFSFTQLNDDKNFFINGKKFDHMRIDTRVPLGNIEEWTIRNDSDDMHVFHIHQLHFQVAEINGKPQAFEGYVDDVRVPERGQVKLILPFIDRQIIGTFMYHCHVLKHEDGGMMANIEVYDPQQTTHADATPDMSMMHMDHASH